MWSKYSNSSKTKNHFSTQLQFIRLNCRLKTQQFDFHLAAGKEGKCTEFTEYVWGSRNVETGVNVVNIF